jgi:hypothetical protein
MMGRGTATARDCFAQKRKGAKGAKGCEAAAWDCFTQRRKGATGAKTIALCIFEKIMGVVVEIWWRRSIFEGIKKILRNAYCV